MYSIPEKPSVECQDTTQLATADKSNRELQTNAHDEVSTPQVEESLKVSRKASEQQTLETLELKNTTDVEREGENITDSEVPDEESKITSVETEEPKTVDAVSSIDDEKKIANESEGQEEKKGEDVDQTLDDVGIPSAGEASPAEHEITETESVLGGETKTDAHIDKKVTSELEKEDSVTKNEEAPESIHEDNKVELVESFVVPSSLKSAEKIDATSKVEGDSGIHTEYTASELSAQLTDNLVCSSSVIEESEYDEDVEAAGRQHRIPTIIADKEELLQEYQTLLEVGAKIKAQSFEIQNQLSEYFKRKKPTSDSKKSDHEITVLEERYKRYMINLRELQEEEEDLKVMYSRQTEEAKRKCEEMVELVKKETEQFKEFKRETALKSFNTRTGKCFETEDIEHLLAKDAQKEADVAAMRLENITFKNKLQKAEENLRDKKELAEGLHLIDFEQLKIENQTHNEKIEERNDELFRLRKKITSTVQILTHVKEKVLFMEVENKNQVHALSNLDVEVAKQRENLNRIKQERDAVRANNELLQRKCGLLGNNILLYDYEDHKDEISKLTAYLEELKQKHAALLSSRINLSPIQTTLNSTY